MDELSNLGKILWSKEVWIEPGQVVNDLAPAYYYHLVYIVSGEYNVSINGEMYALSEDMLVLIKPGEISFWRNSSGMPISTYQAKFSILAEEFREAVSKTPSVIHSNNFVKTLIERIIHKKDNSIYFKLFLYDLKREGSPSTPDVNQRDTKKLHVQIISTYIEEHYNEEDISLDKIAKVICFNKSYVANMFKQVTGITVNEYIYRTRIYKSCELINYGDLSLAEVSKKVGFKNQYHFNRVFKKYMGLPPGDYRDATPQVLIDYRKDSGLFFNVETLSVRPNKNYQIESDSGVWRPSEK